MITRFQNHSANSTKVIEIRRIWQRLPSFVQPPIANALYYCLPSHRKLRRLGTGGIMLREEMLYSPLWSSWHTTVSWARNAASLRGSAAYPIYYNCYYSQSLRMHCNSNSNRSSQPACMRTCTITWQAAQLHLDPTLCARLRLGLCEWEKRLTIRVTLIAPPLDGASDLLCTVMNTGGGEQSVELSRSRKSCFSLSSRCYLLWSSVPVHVQ